MEETTTSRTSTPPKHWRTIQELDPSYCRENKENDKEVAWLELTGKAGLAGIGRRDFLTIMGASMAMATFACARRPVHKIIPYVVKPEEITLGVPTWYASTCRDCEAACGILIKNREGRPIKLEGNPDHLINNGKICARGQASVLGLYDPDRLKGPIARERSSGFAKQISWADADGAIQARLKQIASSGGRIRLLSGEIGSPSGRKLINEFLGAFRSGELVEYEPLALEEIAGAQQASYGEHVIPHYRFDTADLVVSLDADFLGTWPQAVGYSAAWAKRRKLHDQPHSHAEMSKLVCFESAFSVTGANADERYPVRPGDGLQIALALAHEVILVEKHSRFASDPSVTSLLRGYSPQTVASEIGIDGGASKLREMAHALIAHKGRSIVLGGGISSKTKDAVSLQIAINLLNSALNNEGSTIDGTSAAMALHSQSVILFKLISDMKAGLVDVLMIHGSNPAYTFPQNVSGFEDAMRKVPLVISFADREDETALFADYVLPNHHYLENWGDANPRKGTYSLQQPAMAPIHKTRAFEDSLLTWIKGAPLNSSGFAKRSETWHDYLKSHWQETVYREKGDGSPFEKFWENALRVGVLETRKLSGTAPRSFSTGSITRIPRYAPSQTQPKPTGVTLALYPKVSMHDGRVANNAWLQEMPDPVTAITWDNYLNVSPELARSLDLKENDVVSVTTEQAKVELPIHVHPGIHPSVATVAVGYGRRRAGKVGTGTGVDVYRLLDAKNGSISFSGMSAIVTKTHKFYALANTQWHTATQNRPVINDITLAQYRKDPRTALHTDPHLRMDKIPTAWPTFEYKGHRWAMAIDLNACTGCGACVIGCQAENNVPVVGRDQVRNGRQMHWIKIDRYFSGELKKPDTVFQPMLCQHCENAPCETVCPVLATVHDNEGLNLQIYNRCVGTRYCQNNCPYKVRRFNFFDHWKSYEGPMNLAWNPDVTVRTRGVMEKCTFCLQRIRDAKDKAKDDNKKVQDGQIQTACQQACPTGAIVFGDINDPSSAVAKLAANPRAYRIIEVLNTKPQISYLTKVRNKEEGAHHA